MRIVLASLDYPPHATDGVSRQRQVLAGALARNGHHVHVVTLGTRTESHEQDRVWIHRVARSESVNEYVPSLPVLNRPLTDAQLLCEGVQELAASWPVDLVDVPLWLAQPLALIRHAPCPVVVWLQTTLLHLIELQRRAPRPHEKLLAEIDRFCLSQAAGCIADSQSVLDDVDRLYDVPGLGDNTTMVHPGLDECVPSARPRPTPDIVNALVVGRLEHRKGTRLLFEVLPRLLRDLPALRVTFVGRDNSASDGFRRETGLTYPEMFATRYPEFNARVMFEGYVDDPALSAQYGAADLLIHPSHYESFGLTFLEAMRASLPTVAFRTGGAAEIFAGGERDGAVLCEPGEANSLFEAVAVLAKDVSRRAALGQAAKKRFHSQFEAGRMAEETAAVYASVVAAGGRQAPSPRRPRVFQIMEALQDRDAVSRIARTNAPILAEFGGARPILGLFSGQSVRAETGRLSGMQFDRADAGIFHYWGFSRLERLMARFAGPKAIHFHNITPPRFFSPRSPHYEMTARGYAQLERIADGFDLIVGDSHYNLEAFSQYLSRPKPMHCIYPVVDADELLAADWDRDCAAQAIGDDEPVWLFVGRFAPNKRQDQVMLAFDRFVHATGRGHLVMVGDTTAVPAFATHVERVKKRLSSRSRITLLSSVSDRELRAYYRAASVFVCASEHEGFCVPLAEAMAFGVPTIALDRGAVRETVDGAGILVDEWNPMTVAELAGDLVESPAKHAAAVAAQRVRVQAFSLASARRGLQAVAHSLLGHDTFSSGLGTVPPPGTTEVYAHGIAP